MKKLLQWSCGVFFFAALMGSAVPDDSHPFQLRVKASLCGVSLEPGDYSIVLHDNLADIYRGEQLVVTAKARVSALEEHKWPNTVYCCGGVLMIVRLEKLKVVFPEPLGKPVINKAQTKTLH
jgi:hypothetical protein